MKPAAFDYHRPEGVDEALHLLADHGDGAKILAGGQSLIPVMNFRLAQPAVLVDVNRLAELDTVEEGDDGSLRLGALVRQARLERESAVARRSPLLAEAIPHVAHPQIRNRGTVVGSIVHADPAAELPAVLALLDGHVEVASTAGTRTVAPDDFFLGPLESDVRPGELATAVVFPRPAPGTGTAFVELARRHGDYALAGVGVTVAVEDGRVAGARAAFIGVGDRPEVVDLGEAVDGQAAEELDVAPARDLATAQLQPDADVHATAEYRRHLAGVLLGRALVRAVDHTEEAA